MASQEIRKPTLFISHATSDGDFANAVKQEIEKVFANDVNVFCTSSPGTVLPGTSWLHVIEEKLNSTQAVIAIVTPISIERPWLWFEIGATWLKSKEGGCRIYPLCAPEIKMVDLPSPLDTIQALSLGKANDLKLLFEALIAQFGFGKLSSFKATNITKRIPKYKDVKVKDVDLSERTFYSGEYTGYSDEELMEVIDTELLYPDSDLIHRLSSRGREKAIFDGKLLHFSEIDRDLDLPPGTAKRLLKIVAQRYKLIPYWETENIIRFRHEA